MSYLCMNNPENSDRITRQRMLLRFFFFVMFSTAGMATIATALLAGPLSRHAADRAVIGNQQARISALKELHNQQEELLANAEKPGVLERIAKSNLNYVSAEATAGRSRPLTTTWPELEQALARIDQPKSLAVAPLYERFCRSLAGRRQAQTLLLVLGSLLVLVSMSCFHRRS